MAVTLSSIAASSLTSSQASGQTGVDRVTQAFQKADKRIQQQRDLASVQLSTFGRLKSAFAGTETAAGGLESIKPASSAADVRAATGAFVKAFNSAVETARAATAQSGTPVESNRARAAESELRRSLNADATSAELRNIGLTQQANGTLAIDNNVFETALSAEPDAVRNVLSRMGLQVSQTAASQLADGGNIGRAVNALGDRVRSLETRQAEQQALASAGQQAISAQTNRFTAGLNSGAAAYERIFST
jgi:flagellar hook-associated protein 2